MKFISKRLHVYFILLHVYLQNGLDELVLLYVQAKPLSYSPSDLSYVEFKHPTCCFDAVFKISQFSLPKRDVKMAKTAMRV